MDKLAKEATEEKWDKQLKTPSNDFRKKFKETAYGDTAKEIKIQATMKGQYFHHFFLEEERYPWFQGYLSSSRVELLAQSGCVI